MLRDREKVMRAAAALSQRGQYVRALEEYRKLVLEGPSDPVVMIEIGAIQTTVRAFGEACAAFELGGALFAKSGRLDDAIDAYRKALDAATSGERLDERAVRVARSLALVQ